MGASADREGGEAAPSDAHNLDPSESVIPVFPIRLDFAPPAHVKKEARTLPGPSKIRRPLPVGEDGPSLPAELADERWWCPGGQPFRTAAGLLCMPRQRPDPHLRMVVLALPTLLGPVRYIAAAIATCDV